MEPLASSTATIGPSELETRQLEAAFGGFIFSQMIRSLASAEEGLNGEEWDGAE